LRGDITENTTGRDWSFNTPSSSVIFPHEAKTDTAIAIIKTYFNFTGRFYL